MAERHVGSGQTYATITAAYTAAAGGDEIIIHPGTFSERLEVRVNDKPGLVIRSSDGRDTVIWTWAGSNTYTLRAYSSTGAHDLYLRDLTLRATGSNGRPLEVSGSTSSRYPRIHCEDVWVQCGTNANTIRWNQYARGDFSRCIIEGYHGASGVASLEMYTANWCTFTNCLIYAGGWVAAPSSVNFIHCTFVHSYVEYLLRHDPGGSSQAHYHNCAFYNWARTLSGTRNLWQTAVGTPDFDGCVFYRPSGCVQTDPDLLYDDPELAGGTSLRSAYDLEIPNDGKISDTSPCLEHCLDAHGVTEDFFGNLRPAQVHNDAGFHENDVVPETMKVVGAEVLGCDRFVVTFDQDLDPAWPANTESATFSLALQNPPGNEPSITFVTFVAGKPRQLKFVCDGDLSLGSEYLVTVVGEVRDTSGGILIPGFDNATFINMEWPGPFIWDTDLHEMARFHRPRWLWFDEWFDHWLGMLAEVMEWPQRRLVDLLKQMRRADVVPAWLDTLAYERGILRRWREGDATLRARAYIQGRGVTRPRIMAALDAVMEPGQTYVFVEAAAGPLEFSTYTGREIYAGRYTHVMTRDDESGWWNKFVVWIDEPVVYERELFYVGRDVGDYSNPYAGVYVGDAWVDRIDYDPNRLKPAWLVCQQLRAAGVRFTMYVR